MKELKMNKDKLLEVYKSDIHSFLFDSIIEGNTPAQIIVDDIENISIFLIYEGNCVYFGGEVGDKNKYKEAITFFKENYLNDSRRKEVGLVKINYYPEVWENELLEELKGFKHKVVDRSLFKQELNSVPIIKKNDDLIIKSIDNDILKKDSLGNHNCLIDEVEGMWGSVDNFSNNGFGYCAIMDENIISWCTSEYVSKNYCGIGVETIEECEGKGAATIVANEFLKKCVDLNIVPYWDSWKENTPLVRVAEKDQFEKICDYRIVLVKLN